ncbi:MAG: hypothetical protein M1170_02295 [Patescibacteria group bacterium]|nr:hypothetical protein [Patescibacteria group bacterium]
MKRLVKFVLFFFVFQQLSTAVWALEVQPSGLGLKASWGADKIQLAKRPEAPAKKQMDDARSKEGSRYLHIGGDPKNEYRQLAPGEEWAVSTRDLWVETNSKSGKVYRGLVPPGTVFATSPTNDPTLRKAVWIKKCGNDVLNSESTAIFFRVQPKPTSHQVQGAVAQASQEVAPPPPVVAEKLVVVEPAASKESWWSKNWPWVVGAIAVIGGIVALSGGHGGGNSSPSSGPSPPPPGNQ